MNMVPVLIALMAVEGMQSSVRTAVGYCYFLENAPKESASLLGTLWQVMEAIVLMEITVYYKWISKNWFWTIFFALCMNVLSLILGIFYVPESPKWLYDKQRYEECADVLTYMAKWNGKNSLPSATLLKTDSKLRLLTEDKIQMSTDNSVLS